MAGAFPGVCQAAADLQGPPIQTMLPGPTQTITPGVPPPIQQPPPAEGRELFRCHRDFIYQGKTHECDSLVKQDAEGLRPYVSDTPQAINELNDYQATRRQARAIAYAGSIGLLAALAGVIIARTASSSSTGANIGLWGLGLAGESLIYGLALQQVNEMHVSHAVEMHNEAHPETPIELKFSTGFAF
jgi:hypothetical protein